MEGGRPNSGKALSHYVKKPKLEKEKRKKGGQRGRRGPYNKAFQDISASNSRYELITNAGATETNIQQAASNCEDSACAAYLEINTQTHNQQQIANSSSVEPFISTSNCEPSTCGHDSTSNAQTQKVTNISSTNTLGSSPPVISCNVSETGTCYQPDYDLVNNETGSNTVPDTCTRTFELAFSADDEHDYGLLAGNFDPVEENSDVTGLGSEPIENYADDYSPDQSDEEGVDGVEDEADQNILNDEFGKSDLYENAGVSVSETILLIMTYSRRFKLSNVATDYLLKLINLLLPEENNFITSLKKVKKYFTSLDRDTTKVYYCRNCEEIRDSFSDVCECDTIQNQSDYFLALPVEKQLKAILEGKTA